MYKTFNGVITETVPELEHSRIQWVVVAVVVVFFFLRFVFLKRTLDSNEEIHTGLINRTGAPEASVFPIHKKAELPNYGLFQRAFLSISKLTNQSLVFTCYGVVKPLFLFSILKHIIIFYKQKKYVALFTKHSGFHITVQS